MKPKSRAALKDALQAGFAAFLVVGVAGVPFSYQAGSRAPVCTYYEGELSKLERAIGTTKSHLELKLMAEGASKPPREATPKALELGKRIKQTVPELQRNLSELDQLKEEQERTLGLCTDAARQGFQGGLTTAAIASGLLLALYLFVTKGGLDQQ